MQEYDIKTIMKEIEQDLIVRMKRTLWSHKEDEKLKGFNWPQWQALKLKQLEEFRKNNKEIFRGFDKKINIWTKIQMKKQFREGAKRTVKKAIKAGKIRKEDSQLGGSFFGLNHRKLDALIKSTKEDMKDVKYATLRMANDQYRQIIYKAQVYANTGVGTVKQAIDMATRDFLVRGFNCIEYKDGSRHNIADYCDMAVRTANKRANLMGEGEMRKKLGNPLVYISKHSTSCDKCGQWQGRVYIDDVWSGGKAEDGKYPLLSTAIAGGLFHPRCQHGSSTYYEGINEEPEEVTQAKHNHNEEDKYTQYLQQRQKQYERLSIGSLYSENILNYQNKAKELQNETEHSKIDTPEVFNEITSKQKQQFSNSAKKFVDDNITDIDILIDKSNTKPIFYDINLKKIIVNPNNSNWEYYKIDEAIVHEVAHLKDEKNNIIVNNYDKLQPILESARKYVKNNYSYFYNFLSDRHSDMSMCDILSALTNGKLQGDFGHRVEYWSNDIIVLKEITSNLISSHLIKSINTEELLVEIPPLRDLKKECLKLWEVGD